MHVNVRVVHACIAHVELLLRVLLLMLLRHHVLRVHAGAATAHGRRRHIHQVLLAASACRVAVRGGGTGRAFVVLLLLHLPEFALSAIELRFSEHMTTLCLKVR